MKKLSFTVLALIALVGTMFAPSKAWSQSEPLTNKVCFISDGPIATINTAIIQADPAEEKNILLGQLEDHNLFNGISPTCPATHEVLGVTSWPSISRLNCNAVNPEHVLINNEIKSRLGIDIHLC